jgi:ABC-type Zn2+ transport system substrate-binding protein/surface adhesin
METVMIRLKAFFLASTLLAGSAGSASAEVNVVASIKPVHSLVAAVMEGVGEPGLIIEGAGSPHTYALKPSQAQMLEQADVVFWVGHELEAFLEKPLETVGANAKSIELIDAHDLVKLGFREGGAFEKHDHGDEAGHDDHAHSAETEHDHDHDKTAEVMTMTTITTTTPPRLVTTVMTTANSTPMSGSIRRTPRRWCMKSRRRLPKPIPQCRQIRSQCRSRVSQA